MALQSILILGSASVFIIIVNTLLAVSLMIYSIKEWVEVRYIKVSHSIACLDQYFIYYMLMM